MNGINETPRTKKQAALAACFFKRVPLPLFKITKPVAPVLPGMGTGDRVARHLRKPQRKRSSCATTDALSARDSGIFAQMPNTTRSFPRKREFSVVEPSRWVPDAACPRMFQSGAGTTRNALVIYESSIVSGHSHASYVFAHAARSGILDAQRASTVAQDLQSAVDHALAVERHSLWVHHVRQARVPSSPWR